jgi:hypothetical protein
MRKPIVCPFCGSEDLHRDVADWNSSSMDDPDNTEVLNENQCDKCGMSFWT